MSETPASTDVIQGTLDMLILKALSLEPMHGFGIARRIEQTSKGVFKVNPGSLLGPRSLVMPTVSFSGVLPPAMIARVRQSVVTMARRD